MTATHRAGGTRLLILMAAASVLGGCKTRPVPGTYIVRQNKQDSASTAAGAPTPSTAPKTQPALGTVTEAQRNIADTRYVNFVRPLLRQHRCDAGQCHGNITFKGGFYLSISVDQGIHDYRTVLRRIDRKEPEKSQLVQKALGQIEHIGGINLDAKSCEVQRLLAWIGERPDPACSDPPPPDPKERFVREVVPALNTMGCAEQSCHGGETKARARLDLSELHAPKPRMELVAYSFSLTPQNKIAVYRSAAVKAANADDGIHKKAIDPLSCGYRRLYGFIAGAPEIRCDVADDARGVRQRGLPTLAGFAEHVVPVLERRGCNEMTCHGGDAGNLPLSGNLDIPQVVMHDFIMLTSRVEDFARPDQSTLMRASRNLIPHGGGRAMGGKGDCLDGTIVTWLSGKMTKTCPPAAPPSYERYAKEIQPVIDHMTCGNKKCHGGGYIPHFVLNYRATAEKDVRANYASVLHQIDPDFMPFSQVQLRMREPCAYAIVGAWIQNKPKPSCQMGPPDPSAFPRRDDDGNVMPAKPGPDPHPAPPAPPGTTTKT